MAATGGTDNFSDVWLDPPPGSDRTFAHLSRPADARRTGSTRSSAAARISRPVRCCSLRGRGPAGPATRSRLPAGAPSSLRVSADVVSIAPLETLEILVNGDVVQTVRATDPLHVTFDGRVEVPQGGWVARARQRAEVAVSRRRLRLRPDESRVCRARRAPVSEGGGRAVSLPTRCDAIWTRVERSRWRSDAERDAFRAAVDRAMAVYKKLRAEAGQWPGTSRRHPTSNAVDVYDYG